MKVILVVTKDTVTGEAVTAIQANKNEAEAKRAWGMAIQEIEKIQEKHHIKISNFTK